MDGLRDGDELSAAFFQVRLLETITKFGTGLNGFPAAPKATVLERPKVVSAENKAATAGERAPSTVPVILTVTPIIAKSIRICSRPPPRTAPKAVRARKRTLHAAQRKLLIPSQPFSYPDPTQSEKGDLFDIRLATLKQLELETIELERFPKKSLKKRVSRTGGSSITKAPTVTKRRLSKQLKPQPHQSASLHHTSSVPAICHSLTPPTLTPQRRDLKIKNLTPRDAINASSPDLPSTPLPRRTASCVSVLSSTLVPPESIPDPVPLYHSPGSTPALEQCDPPQTTTQLATTASSVCSNDSSDTSSDTEQSDSEDTPTLPQRTTSAPILYQPVIRDERLTQIKPYITGTVSTTVIRDCKLTPTKSQVTVIRDDKLTPTKSQVTVIRDDKLTPTKSQVTVIRDDKLTPTKSQVTVIRDDTLTPPKSQVTNSTIGSNGSKQRQSCPSSLTGSKGAKPLVFTSLVRPITPQSRRDRGSPKSCGSFRN